MAELPKADVLQATQGGGVANGNDLLCIMSAVPQGTTYQPRLFTKVQDSLNLHNYHEALDLAAMHVEVNKKPFLEVGLEIADEATIGPVNLEGVLGTSTWSFSGTPKDEEDLQVRCVTGGTRGVAGIVIQTSRDGGRVWSKKIRLGTATSYLIPRTSVTVNFSVGTLVAGDIAKARCESAKPDAAGLLAAFNSLVASTHLPRLIYICGDIDTITKCQDIVDRINAYETSGQRHSRVMFSARQRYADCAMQRPRGTFKRAGVVPADVDFVAASDTITRDTGSWIDDGFAVGQSVTVAGSASNNGVKGVISALSATVMTLPASPGVVDEASVAGSALTITGISPGDLDFAATTIGRNVGSFVTDGFKVGMNITVDGTASNDGEYVLTAVTALQLTHDGGGVSEANVSALGVSITGTESSTAWKDALNVIVGATPQTEIIAHRAAIRAGRGRRSSPIDGTRRRRPEGWAEAIRIMGHEEAVAPNNNELGGCGWTIHDERGLLEDHDERVDGGLLAMRYGCFTTSDTLEGIYFALGVTLDEDNAPLSRIQSGFVCDLLCTVAKRETSRKLGAGAALNPKTGFILPAARELVEKAVFTQLQSAALTPGKEGPKASAVEFTMEGGIDMRTPGVLVPCEVVVTTLGYFERISTTVRVNVGG